MFPSFYLEGSDFPILENKIGHILQHNNHFHVNFLTNFEFFYRVVFVDRLKVLALPLLAFLILFSLRLYQIGLIFKEKEFYFWGENVPLLSSSDGYYFLRLAELIKEGSYKGEAPDPLRNAPDNQLKPDSERAVRFPLIPPLISVLLALLSHLTGVPPEKAFVVFPLIPFLGSLLAFPLYGIGKRLWGELCGFGMALGGGLCLEYVIRTDLLRIDTEAIALVFFFSVVYLMLIIIEDFTLKNLILFSLSVHLYEWWYSHPGLLLPLLAAYGVVLLLVEKFSLKESAKRTLILALFSNPLILFNGVFNLFEMIKGYIPGLLPEQLGFIPRSVFASSVSELQRLPMKVVLSMVSSHYLIGFIGLLGFLGLFLKNKRALLISPPFLLGLMSLFGARRFMIWLGPFVGLGLGVLLQYCFEVLRKNLKLKPMPLKVGLIILLCIFTIPPRSLKFFPLCPYGRPLLEGIKELERLTSENSFIWSWWDYGYVISLVAKRPVYHDGGSWGGPKSILVAKSLTLADPEKAYNIINGTTSLGEEGIRELLEKGEPPSSIISQIENGLHNKELKRKVYLLLSGDDTSKFFWISFFGTWDPEKEKGEHLFYFALGLCQMDEGRIRCQNGIFDQGKGVLQLRDGTLVKIGKAKMVELDSKDLPQKKENLKVGEGFFLLLMKKGDRLLGWAAHPKVESTMFQRLFFEENELGKFKLIYSNFPYLRVFEVSERG